MNLRFVTLSSTLLFAVAAGCYTGTSVDANRTPTAAIDKDNTDPAPEVSISGSDGGGSSEASALGLPCEVASLLTSSCNDCHGEPLAGRAQNHLLTYEDLAAPSESDPEKTVAELAVLRMKSTKKPMPPGGKLDDDKIGVLEKWVEAGMPRGTCGGSPPADAGTSVGHDGGVSKDGGSASATSVCTSGTFATPGASALMKPGRACIACHSATGAPAFEIAGTVYPSLHEPNDCNGSQNVKVIIIDATGTPHNIATNEAGNFTRRASLPRPYRAMVVRGTEVREMKTPQTDGDCNGCHSEFGNKSPGRVMAP